MASSTYSNPPEYRRYFPILPDVSGTTQHSHTGSSQSPWSATSQVSADHLTLTLPSISPGNLPEVPSLYPRLQSPTSFLAEDSMAAPLNLTPQIPPTPVLRPRRSMEHYHTPNSESADLFLNFEDTSQPQNRPSSTPQVSSIVNLTRSSLNMASSSKRKYTGNQVEVPAKRKRDVPFIGKEEPPIKKDVEELDLVDVDNDLKYEDFRAKQQNPEKAEKPIKLTDFQCIICLDNPTDLTVTHCGHLFCSLCLHEALHAGTQRKTCPVCRQQINLSKNKEGKQPKNGIFVLEMKLMTAKKKEKQPESPWHW